MIYAICAFLPISEEDFTVGLEANKIGSESSTVPSNANQNSSDDLTLVIAAGVAVPLLVIAIVIVILLVIFMRRYNYPFVII